MGICEREVRVRLLVQQDDGCARRTEPSRAAESAISDAKCDHTHGVSMPVGMRYSSALLHPAFGYTVTDKRAGRGRNH